MRNPRLLAPCAFLLAALVGCADGESPFTGGGNEGGSAPSNGGGGNGSGMGGEGGTNTSTISSSDGGMGGMGGAADGGMGEGGMGGMDPCALGCPQDLWDVDNNPITGECGCEYECEQTSADTDPIDEDFTDDNCDGGDGLVEQCVYVSASTGSDATGSGTREMPLATIAGALAVAQANGVPAVCLSGEDYNESVNVVSGISIYGGFDHLDPDFKFRRKAGITTRVIATGTVFNVASITSDTHIEGLTIIANQANGGGASTYGVHMVNGNSQGTLFVRYNVIQVGAGANGSDGGNGNPHAQSVAPGGNAGENGCDGCSGAGAGGPQTNCTEFGGKGGNGGYGGATGQNGSPGSGNAPVGLGDASNGCFGSVETAGTGGNGSPNGAQGQSGGGGTAIGTVAGGIYAPSNGGIGIGGANGKGGSGGGGGGGGESDTFCNSDRGGGGGSGGCGGLGGNPGLGGQGGGGSFGVFVAAGKIEVADNEITTASGGAGGDGGNGAAGQTGGTGGIGGGSADDADAGGPGGSGSNGGAGGPGGGGGGGPSACLARSSAATFTFMGNSCTTGLPGVGGGGGTNPQGGLGGTGTNGTASPNLQIN
ncbi:MAG: PE-PGRS family protein [Polyangiaceae bacterium]|nr:PE-PGRS family protein [Polyangiaceae bacterium]